ncbi:MAG TPA: nitroreductase family deazaflavin-dependent oxidoreductase [Chloroflexota bacterium]
MPLPRWVARSNKYLLNHLTRPLARHLPGFGVVVHKGRKTGRRYLTPVNVFHHGDGYIIALTYGRESEWVRNVLAAGECQLITRGRTLHMAHPRLVHDEKRRSIPRMLHPVGVLGNVADFVELWPAIR